jgi:beta-lactamase superfamily II metal-dependent hydrolase
MSENPTAKQADNVSPIIYLEIQGVRFVFTGDAGMAQEQAVLDNIKIAFYQAFIKSSGIEINFDGIDFLKMSDGGSNSATSAAFAKLLKAKNAVVFSGDGRFPDNSAIHNLWNANNDYKLWRTDVYGTISVKIEPLLSSLSTLISAPKSSVMDLQMVRPSPVLLPPLVRVLSHL